MNRITEIAAGIILAVVILALLPGVLLGLLILPAFSLRAALIACLICISLIAIPRLIRWHLRQVAKQQAEQSTSPATYLKPDTIGGWDDMNAMPPGERPSDVSKSTSDSAIRAGRPSSFSPRRPT